MYRTRKEPQHTGPAQIINRLFVINKLSGICWLLGPSQSSRAEQNTLTSNSQ